MQAKQQLGMSEHACACSVNCHASSSSPFCAHMLPLRTHAAQRRTHTHTPIQTYYIDPSTKISPKATAAAAADDRDNPQVASGSKNRLPNFQLYTQTHTYNKKAATPTPKKKKRTNTQATLPKKKKQNARKEWAPLSCLPWVGARLWQSHKRDASTHTHTYSTRNTP